MFNNNTSIFKVVAIVSLLLILSACSSTDKNVAPPPPPEPAPAPAPPPPTYILDGDITFAHDSATLRPEAKSVLNGAIEGLKTVPDTKYVVEGHTDSDGTEDYNMGLSQRRAESVELYMESHGIPSDQLVPEAYGETRPSHDNSTKEGRRQNRRVEIHPIN